MFASFVSADVGETHELKTKRAEILKRIAKLENDSIQQIELTDSLKQAVIELDGRIMESYDETVARLAAQKRERGSNSRASVYVALITTAVALLAFLLLLVARKRIMKNHGGGILRMYRELTSDFVHSVSAEKAESKSVLRINIVVVAGLILMSASVIAFLIRTL